MDSDQVTIITGMGKAEVVWLCLIIIIWSVTVFLAGMSYSRPDCQLAMFRAEKTDELITVCVVEDE